MTQVLVKWQKASYMIIGRAVETEEIIEAVKILNNGRHSRNFSFLSTQINIFSLDLKINMADSGGTFPAADAEIELNPEKNKDFQVDSVSSKLSANADNKVQISCPCPRSLLVNVCIKQDIINYVTCVNCNHCFK